MFVLKHVLLLQGITVFDDLSVSLAVIGSLVSLFVKRPCVGINLSPFLCLVSVLTLFLLSLPPALLHSLLCTTQRENVDFNH